MQVRRNSCEPLKGLIKSKSPWLALLRDFNFNYVPTLISFRADVTRQFGATRMRNIGGGGFLLQETYDKYFRFDRYYSLKWDLSRNLSFELQRREQLAHRRTCGKDQHRCQERLA